MRTFSSIEEVIPVHYNKIKILFPEVHFFLTIVPKETRTQQEWPVVHKVVYVWYREGNIPVDGTLVCSCTSTSFYELKYLFLIV